MEMEKTAMQMVKDEDNLVNKFQESYGSFKPFFLTHSFDPIWHP